MRQEFYNDNGPGNRSRSPKVAHQPWDVRVKPGQQKRLILWTLQSEIRQVAVAHGGAVREHEQASVRHHQGAENSDDGAKLPVAVLDIWAPFLNRGGAPR
jgi:hypothetical protein